jgi:hypothetical protein
VIGVETSPVGWPVMKPYQRGLLVATLAVAGGLILRVRGKGPVPAASNGGWRELQGPEYR